MKKQKREPRGDYDVGYCRPPVATQFKKGQKPPPRRHFESTDPVDVGDLLDGLISVTVAGRREKMTQYEAMLLAMLRDGLNGKVSSLRYVLKEFEKHNLIKRTLRKAPSPVQLFWSEMPRRMSFMMLETFGRSPWSSEQIRYVQKLYLESRTPKEVEDDELYDYMYAKEGECPPHF